MVDVCIDLNLVGCDEQKEEQEKVSSLEPRQPEQLPMKDSTACEHDILDEVSLRTETARLVKRKILNKLL